MKTFAPIGALVLILGLTYVSCAKPSVHTVADATNNAVAQALFSLDDQERAAFQAGAIPPDAHKAISAKLVVALKSGQALNRVLATWVPGTPLPADVRTLVANVGQTADLIVTLIPDSPTKTALVAYVNALRSAVDAFLVALAGGVQ